jgi:hypothetical protein
MARKTINYRTDNTHGQRAYLTKLRQSFTERERGTRERVRLQHRPHIEFLEKRGLQLENLREASARRVAAGTLAGLLALTPVSGIQPTKPNLPQSGVKVNVKSVEDVGAKLSQALKSVVPANSEDLSAEQERSVSQSFKEILGVQAVPELDGRRLNRTFGLIGAEQHLYRYPGDNIFEHAETPYDFAKFSGAGIAPGLGAYGYFARSESSLTDQDVEREKWYVVAQTFLAPGFVENPQGTTEFFRYRKFLVVNPDSGAAVVGDLADAGPALYTGKSFGGSPEVMDALGYGEGPRKGRVIFYFLNDPKNQIPLGPVSSKVGQ